MSDPNQPVTNDETAQLLGLMRGFVVAQCLYLAAKCGVADRLRAGPKPVEEIAHETGAHPDALYRILRALSSVGIFQETARRQFGLTPLAERLRRDAPGSLRNWFLTNGGPIYSAFTQSAHTLATGQPGFERAFGRSFFEYLKETPEENAIFNAAMREFTAQANRSLMDAYDFGGIRSAVDVGGGNGALMAALLEEYPQLTGAVLDLPHVLQEAAPLLQSLALGGRLGLTPGSFFEGVPSDADLYILAWILHDWEDDRAELILRNCRLAMKPGARLLILESIVPEGNAPHFSKFGDIIMMVLFGSRERTEEEYRALLGRAGLMARRVIHTSCPRSIIEAVPCR